MTVISTPESLLVNIQIKGTICWSNSLNLIRLLIVHPVIQLQTKTFQKRSIYREKKIIHVTIAFEQKAKYHISKVHVVQKNKTFH